MTTEHTPVVWVTENYRNGQPRFGWICDGCHAEKVGILSRELATKAALSHTCPT